MPDETRGYLVGDRESTPVPLESRADTLGGRQGYLRLALDADFQDAAVRGSRVFSALFS